MIYRRQFWAVAFDRAVRTAAQIAAVTLGAGVVDLIAVDWPNVASLAAGGFIASLLTSMALPPTEAKP